MNEKSKPVCPLEQACAFEGEPRQNRDLFSRDWEVFVIKRDNSTGNLVGKTACCALAPV